eukprot:TRINITY_DN14114_c0_g2_i1.p1 TRINITY_DN14114_c0_g2~~TRINITY_DN14114_c0_g2_i1.p1  ORF type:complete len:1024 (-),score=227.62 TRINITY_DN14114_c0_g2_i1:97-2958(-)
MGHGQQTGYRKVDMGPHSNDFEQGDIGNYAIYGNRDIQATHVCLMKKCVFFSDDWCPSSVNVFNRANMEHFGEAKFRRMNSCKQKICVPLGQPQQMPEPKGKLVLDFLFMGDIGHAPEHSEILTRNYPMGKNKVDGSFSLWRGLRDFVENQGNRPEAVLIMGDVGYVGGDKTGTAAMADSFQTYLNKVVPPDMVFPQIGNHDIHYIGCIFPTPMQTCYYGAKTYSISMGSVASESISFDKWMGNWATDFPGLTQKTIVPPRMAALPANVPKWAAPLRYNIDLKPESSVYVIAGLVPGAAQASWGPKQPPVAHPAKAGHGIGLQIECAFLSDSIAYGRSLGKTVFIYVTHDYTQLPCPDIVNEIDVWLYGHIHTIDQNVPHRSTITQEWRKQHKYPPVRMLIGNGGFDEGEEDTVSFGNMREYSENGRVSLHFEVYDTCISAENCPSGIVPNQHCWDRCHDFNEGFMKRKATKNKKGIGFVYEAPAKSSNRGASEAEVGGPQIKLPAGEEEVMVMKEDDDEEEWDVDKTAKMFGSADIPVGCVAWGVSNKLASTEVPRPEVAACKRACMDQQGCGAWNFDFKTKRCWIQGPAADGAAPAATGYEFVGKHIVSGPPDCGKIGAICKAEPTAAFPAETAAASMAAWPTGFQPQTLQCWPRRQDGSLYSCPEVTALRDVEAGWPGKCKYMIKEHIGQNEYCRDKCMQSPTCPAWLQTKSGDCYHGIGNDCYGGSGDAAIADVVKGQRLIKGTYRVLMNLTGGVLRGLGNTLSPASIRAAEASGVDASTACQETCLSYTYCTFWQLRKQSGCFIEMNTDTVRPVHYPLTRDSFVTSEDDPAVAGEYIQRFCPSYFSDRAIGDSVAAVAGKSIIGLDEDDAGRLAADEEAGNRSNPLLAASSLAAAAALLVTFALAALRCRGNSALAAAGAGAAGDEDHEGLLRSEEAASSVTDTPIVE